MSNTFVAAPDVLRMEGNSILDKGQQFGQNVEKVYATIAEMTGTDYLSPAARAIANQIETYKDDLDKMTKIINDYGQYCLTASNTVDKNEQNIIDSVTTNNIDTKDTTEN